MKKYIIFILVFAIIGLVVGYFIFGRIQGEYIALDTIFSSSENIVESLGRDIAGLESIKQNIMISGGVGALLGLIIRIFTGRK